MRLLSRLKQLEIALNVIEPMNQHKQYTEYFKVWRTNEAESIILMKQFEEYCISKGCSPHGAMARVELTRTDPRASELAHSIINSFKGFVKTNYGVTLNETG